MSNDELPARTQQDEEEFSPSQFEVSETLWDPMSRPPECEWCGQILNRKYAVRVAETGPRTSTGPVWFCNEDCREAWRHHRA